MFFSRKYLLSVMMLLQSVSAFALEDNKEVAKASLNPFKINHFSKYVSLPFENDTNFNTGLYDDRQNILNFKPVVPIVLSANYDLIIRTIAPLFERTPSATPDKMINGWGDLNPTLFLTPAKFNHVMWGVGSTFFLPTASNNKYIGSGKYSIGPELGIYAMPGNWMLGFLTYNIWSVAGDPQRQAVNQFSFQYLISYVFEKGWFISSNPTITADWQAKSNQQWIVPFGLSAGRTFNVEGQPLSVSAAAYYNVVRPSVIGPTWQMQLELEWLFKGI